MPVFIGQHRFGTLEQYDTSAIGQLLSGVGDGAARCDTVGLHGYNALAYTMCTSLVQRMVLLTLALVQGNEQLQKQGSKLAYRQCRQLSVER